MTASAYRKTRQRYEFGPFRVDPEKELLLRDNEAIPLNPKAFQVLLVLIRHKQELVTKDELLKAVWPDTFVEETNLSRNIFLLRKALGESPQDHQYVVTVPGRGYRFAEDVQFVPGEEVNLVAASHSKVEVQVKETRPWVWIGAASVLLVALALTIWKLFPARTYALTARDTVVLADFANSTGDPAFDGALRQGLAIQLEQSPFLSLVPEARVGQVLTMMGQTRDTRLTAEIAREVCQRTGSAAVIEGSIASLGKQYVLGLRAVNCHSGDALAEEQATVDTKERVLTTLSQAAAQLRTKLGETLSTVQKFDTPIEQATTPSLAALQAYGLGRKAMAGNDWTNAIPFMERAIRLDPNFAMAYARLGTSYKNLGETNLAFDNIVKAYELRERTSEREKVYLESHYYQNATGDLEKAREVYELWAKIYPRDWTPQIDLWDLYTALGQGDKALVAVRDCIRLDQNPLCYGNYAFAYVFLGRLQEAHQAAQEAQAKQLDSPGLHAVLYRLAYLENDKTGMEREVAWAASKPGVEDVLLSKEADTFSSFGQTEKAREMSRRAVASAERAKLDEVAALYEASAAMWEALYGNSVEARKRAAAARRLSTGRNSEFGVAFALAFAGDAKGAQIIADDLVKRFPDDTMVRFNYLPTIVAKVQLSRGQPSKAVDVLQSAMPYELGVPAEAVNALYPVYVRGLAYLASQKPSQAAVEFQKIMDHPGNVYNKPPRPLAYLGLARAYAMQGNTAAAKAAYRTFLDLWKEADANTPILKEAKAEYAKLK
jgi:eukaryotic-like serine/threonine-protein kinase